jgi:hypothetical protein
VPSGLTLYWFVNNIISTAMQIYMKRTIQVDLPPPAAAAGEAPAIIDVSGTVIKPKEDRSARVRDLTGCRVGVWVCACACWSISRWLCDVTMAASGSGSPP